MKAKRRQARRAEIRMIKLGCCGFPGGMSRYFGRFRLVEVNSTFYRLPRVETAERWRAEAPGDFEFAVKAWQAITHPSTSPTWRRAGVQVGPGEQDRYGFLRPTEEVLQAWERTREICRVLDARVCLIQCPASFQATEANVRNMRRLLSEIERGGLNIAWEPRGTSWTDEKVRGLCAELGLTHCVDPFAGDPVAFSGETAYLRLHGRPPGERMYYYRYTDEDLGWLLKKLRALEAQRLTVYCLFNNVSMGEDAERFAHVI